MATPTVSILTLKEQQKAFAGKGRKKKSVRNLLGNPYESFWPLLDNDQCQKLENLFKTLFPAARDKKILLPWRLLKGKARVERRQMLQAKQKKEDPYADVRRDLRNHLKLGVNAVTRGLETGSIAAVMLSSDVDPVFINRHVAQLCGIQGVPVVALPSLREGTRSHLGISCIALGLKVSVVEPSNHFHTMFIAIKGLSQTFKHPNIVKIFRNPHLCKTEVPKLPALSTTDAEQKSDSESDAERSESETQPTTEKMEVSEDVYLYRTSRRERIFVPEIGSAPQVEEEISEGEEKKTKRLSDFMALGVSSDSEQEQEESWKPLCGISLKFQASNKPRPSHFVPAKIRRVRAKPAKKK